MGQKQMLKQMFKQTIELNQVTSNNAFKVAELFQNQFENVANQTMDQAPELSVESRETFEACSEVFKESCSNYKKLIDANLAQAEKLFM